MARRRKRSREEGGSSNPPLPVPQPADFPGVVESSNGSFSVQYHIDIGPFSNFSQAKFCAVNVLAPWSVSGFAGFECGPRVASVKLKESCQGAKKLTLDCQIPDVLDKTSYQFFVPYCNRWFEIQTKVRPQGKTVLSRGYPTMRDVLALQEDDKMEIYSCSRPNGERFFLVKCVRSDNQERFVVEGEAGRPKDGYNTA